MFSCHWAGDVYFWKFPEAEYCARRSRAQYSTSGNFQKYTSPAQWQENIVCRASIAVGITIKDKILHCLYNSFQSWFDRFFYVKYLFLFLCFGTTEGDFTWLHFARGLNLNSAGVCIFENIQRNFQKYTSPAQWQENMVCRASSAVDITVKYKYSASGNFQKYTSPAQWQKNMVCRASSASDITVKDKVLHRLYNLF